MIENVDTATTEEEEEKIIENFQTQFQFPVALKGEEGCEARKVYLYDFRLFGLSLSSPLGLFTPHYPPGRCKNDFYFVFD